MIFKTKKVPRHLIIEDDYDSRKKPRMGFFKLAFLTLCVVSLTYVVSVGVMQI